MSAIYYAGNGFPVYPLMVEVIAEHEADYRKFPTNVDLYLPKGRPPQGGAGVMIASQSGHRLPALSLEQNKALATSPVEALLGLPLPAAPSDDRLAVFFGHRLVHHRLDLRWGGPDHVANWAPRTQVATVGCPGVEWTDPVIICCRNSLLTNWRLEAVKY